MNKIILLLLFPFCAIAQHEFKAVDSKIVWQQVFADSVSAQDYIKHINTTLSQQIPAQLNTDYISGQTTYMDLIDDKSSLSAFYRMPIKFDYLVEFKDHQYRVTVRNIAFKGISVSIYGVTDDADTYIDKSMIRSRDGELRKNNMSQNVLTRLDIAFKKLFTHQTVAGW